MMDLNTIKMTEIAFNEICMLLNNSIGDVKAQDLDDVALCRLMAAVMDISYKVGYRDAVNKIT